MRRKDNLCLVPLVLFRQDFVRILENVLRIPLAFLVAINSSARAT